MKPVDYTKRTNYMQQGSEILNFGFVRVKRLTRSAERKSALMRMQSEDGTEGRAVQI